MAGKPPPGSGQPPAPGPLVGLNPAELPLGTQVGRWRLLEKLGTGGYGAVYLASDVRPVEQGGWPGHVAVKVALLPGEVAMRSDREAELLSRVNHPNVVGFIEAGRWPDTPTGLPFLVMRYVPGLPLYRWVDLHVTVHRIGLVEEEPGAR